MLVVRIPCSNIWELVAWYYVVSLTFINRPNETEPDVFHNIGGSFDLTLFILIDFSKHIDTVLMEQSIYVYGSLAEISKTL